jgi:hypothetical protein
MDSHVFRIPAAELPPGTDNRELRGVALFRSKDLFPAAQ